MKILARLPLGPVLLIMVIPYEQWSYLWGAFPLWHAHRAAVIAAFLALFLAALLRPLSGTWAKAAVAAAFPVAGLLALFIDLGTVLVLGAVVGAAAALDRTRRNENASLALTIMGAVLLAGAVLPIARSQEQERRVVATETEAIGDIDLVQTPSIIHIVLDGYGSADVLSKLYGHDTSPFFAKLERRGFTVIPNAVTAYSQTLPSMASVMSGATVDLNADQSDKRTLRRNLGFTVSHGPVHQVFENAGYNFAWSESGFALLEFENARRVSGSSFWITDFETQLLPGSGHLFAMLHNARLKAATTPGTLAGLPVPYYYYEHLIAPHPPFTVTSDGRYRQNDSPYILDGNNFTRSDPARRALYIEGYREKAQFIEQELIRQIDSFPTGPKIVIIHGDHGPGAFMQFESAKDSCLAERMTTFAAIYSNVPGLELDAESYGSQPFSIVNLYRLVLSRLSNTELVPLEPRSRFLLWSDPRKMTEVSYSDLDPWCGGATARPSLAAD